MVERILKCGHEKMMECHKKVESAYCALPCERSLDCTHQCQQKCGEKCDSKCCQIKVDRQLKCGHNAQLPCHVDPTKHKCTEKVLKRMPSCGHEIPVDCHLDVNDIKCTQPCGTILKCDHNCTGSCGECRQGRLHVRCQQDYNRQLICGHECKYKCFGSCPPCPKPCENRCPHGKCGKKCRELCINCKENCKWQCKHHKCELRCFEPCVRPRCNERCEKKLKKCGHRCIGVCGETCPNLCRECNKDEVDKIARQWSTVEDDQMDEAIFVQLDDCKHVFEKTSLDKFFDFKVETMQGDLRVQIQFLQCPECEKEVRLTKRYGPLLKQCFLDVQAVKAKQQGNLSQLQKRRQNLHDKLEHFPNTVGIAKEAVKCVKELVDKPDMHHFDQYRLASLETLIPILEQMVKMKTSGGLEKLARSLLVNEVHSSFRQITVFVEKFFPGQMKKFEGVEMCMTVRNSSGVVQKWMKPQALIRILHNEMDELFEWVKFNAKCPSEQMLEEFSCEWRRTLVLAHLIEFLLRAVEKKKVINDHGWIKIEQIMKVVIGNEVVKIDAEKNCIEIIKQLIKEYDVMGLTEKERAEIMKAMDLRRGHWFKCKNGHIYAIGDCGGAMQVSVCPECGDQIGGMNHRLVQGNAVASEMDGATQSAYEAAAADDHNLARRLQQQLDRGH